MLENHEGVTPTIVRGMPSTTAVLPMMAGSASKKRRQPASLSTMTSRARDLLSSGPNSRPMAAGTSTVEKKLALTGVTGIMRDSPSVRTAPGQPANCAARLENV